MSFVKDSHTYLLQEIKANPADIISSCRMEKLLKKGNSCIISQFHVIQGCETPTLDPPYKMRKVLDTYSLVFEIPRGLPPS